MSRLGKSKFAGNKYGRLTVLSVSDGKAVCDCECGQSAIVFTTNLVRGHTRSCGCLKEEKKSLINRKHGIAKDYPKIYQAWKNMMGRCYRKSMRQYDQYGGRGIIVCERWHDPRAFWEDMYPTWKEGLSLDRRETNGNYEPDNCRWATRKEQQNNRRVNRMVDTPNGKMTMTMAAESYGMTPNCLSGRLKRGWSMERIFS